MCTGRIFNDDSSFAATASTEALCAPVFGAESKLATVGGGGSVVLAELLALGVTLSCPGERDGLRFCWDDLYLLHNF